MREKRFFFSSFFLAEWVRRSGEGELASLPRISTRASRTPCVCLLCPSSLGRSGPRNASTQDKLAAVKRRVAEAQKMVRAQKYEELNQANKELEKDTLEDDESDEDDARVATQLRLLDARADALDSLEGKSQELEATSRMFQAKSASKSRGLFSFFSRGNTMRREVTAAPAPPPPSSQQQQQQKQDSDASTGANQPEQQQQQQKQQQQQDSQQQQQSTEQAVRLPVV